MELIFFLLSLSSTSAFYEDLSNPQSVTITKHKQKSFFFLPPIIPLSSFTKRRKQAPTKQSCIGDCGSQGFCSLKSDCTTEGGTPSGLCTDSTVCCIKNVKCGSETNAELFYFKNPGHPEFYKGGSQCLIKIKKAQNACQVRIDFKEFSLSQPSNDGKCLNDFFTISDCLMNKICGENKGQHVYADFDGKDTITLSVDTNSAEKTSRIWNMEIKQIPCDSNLLAPSGCLMYYTGTSGSIFSFNYGELKPNENRKNRLIRGLNYGICVKSKSDYCSIEWSPEKEQFSFTLSGNSTSVQSEGGLQTTGESCRNNFIVIANPYQNGKPLNMDRFCGTSLNPVTTSMKPFVLYVVISPNSSDTITDEGNRGFKLNFRQQPCHN